MKEVLAAQSITLSDGIILALDRYRAVSRKSAGPPHVDLVASRGSFNIRMRLGESPSASSMGQLLEMFRRRIERRDQFAKSEEIGTIGWFINEMEEAGMFTPVPLTEAAAK